MKNLYLDTTTYDLTIENYNLKFTSNAVEHLSQKIENRIKTFLGEWFLDNTIGIPYFSRILKKNVDLNEVNNLFIATISGISEISEIISFSTLYNNIDREYSITFSVRTTDGVVKSSITV